MEGPDSGHLTRLQSSDKQGLQPSQGPTQGGSTSKLIHMAVGSL